MYAACRPLDRARERFLRRTLSVALARALWTDRARRHATLAAGMMALNLGLALLAPLWVLALGPAILGALHLVATAQYAPRAMAPLTQRPAAWSRGMALVLGASMVMGLVTPPEWTSYAALALFAVTIAVVFTLLRLTLVARLVIAATAAMIVALAWRHLAVFLGAMVLMHNVFAFVHWAVQAPTARDRKVALRALAAFVLVSGLLFVPALLGLALPAGLGFPGLSAIDIGSAILPWTDDARLWLAATTAYAFGQGMHYFVWLRALPEAADRRPIPCSFRQSAARLAARLGDRGALVALAGAVVLTGTWGALSYGAARQIYFAVAAYHGFAELVPLVVLTGAVLAPRRGT